MKSKAPLALMEQMVMLLVFALAAALCMQAFVKSDEVSLSSDTKSSAALAARNVVEAIRHNGGSPEQALKSAAAMLGGNCEGQPATVDVGMLLYIFYDEDWKVSADADVYQLTAKAVPAEEKGLYRVTVQVSGNRDLMTGGTVAEQRISPGPLQEPELLYELEAAWLEVSEVE